MGGFLGFYFLLYSWEVAQRAEKGFKFEMNQAVTEFVFRLQVQEENSVSMLQYSDYTILKLLVFLRGAVHLNEKSKTVSVFNRESIKFFGWRAQYVCVSQLSDSVVMLM